MPRVISARKTEHVPEPRDESKLGKQQRQTTVDVVIPVYNEERSLPGCIRVLHEYLTREFPFEWTITVVDNASTDGTQRVANELAETTDNVRVLRLERKGRGLALRTAWGFSDADIVVYMDVDLSTGLDALLPLVAPLSNGHSDIAIGSRLAPGARTVRGPKREVISRCYNALIRLSHGAKFSDAQCGFKAARTEIIRPLLQHIEDDSWFFDTELLLLAEHNGLRVHEVPVDWVEDTDTRVNVTSTALDDIRGLIRVARNKASGSAKVGNLPRRPDPAPIHPDAVVAQRRETGLLWQVLCFGVIGVASTVATLLLYAGFRTWWPYWVANFVALTITTLLNTEANRRLTFIGFSRPSGRVHLQGLVVFALYYAFTSGALFLLDTLKPHHTAALELVVLLASSLVGTAGRFVLLRIWVFRQPKQPAKQADDQPQEKVTA
ncbi:MAG: putative glycosyl transferase [Amycolatopsis sp.]|nr:putative glycosyl transferase [Amycolatopsis sp.]